MLSKGTNPIQDKEWNEKVTKAASSFWSAFQMTENGKPKSALLVYTFCLSFVMLAVYVGAFFVVIQGLHNLTAGLPVFFGNLIQALAAAINAEHLADTVFINQAESVEAMAEARELTRLLEVGKIFAGSLQRRKWTCLR